MMTHRFPRAVRVLEVAVAFLLLVALVRVRLVPVPVVVMSVPFLVMLATRPVLRRLALGNIARRPRETMLVLLGSMLGTAIVTGSFIVGDTLDASLSRGATTKLGPIDIVVSAGAEHAEAVRASLEQFQSGDIDGVLPMATLNVVASTVGEAPRAEPAAHLTEVDFAAARGFGGDPASTGIDGSTPEPGTTAIGRHLADDLGIGPGDVVVIHAYGTTSELSVAAVLEQKGVAGFTGSQSSESPVLFAAPGTIAALRQAGPAPGTPPSFLYALSITGGVLDTVGRGELVRDDVIAHLGEVPASVTAVKDELIENANALGDQFTQLFGLIGLFAVLAGVLLLVNIFVMLAQERQSELGMLRAVGLRRLGLVGSFSLEGWLYALGASAMGTVAGLGVGAVIVFVAAPIFGGGQPGSDEALQLSYSASRASTSGGFLIGFTIALATVLLTSVWIARLNVIRAIRELPNPVNTRQRISTLVAGIVVALLGAVVTMGGLRNDRAASVLIGPGLVAIGAIPLFSRLAPRRAVVSAAAGGVLLWAIFAFDIVGRAFNESGIELFVIQGVVLTAAAVALVSQNQELIGHVVRRVAGGSRSMAVRLGLAYPLARRFRTGMTLTMYALVVYTLASITILSQLFGGQLEEFTRRVSGGFDLVVASNPTNPVGAQEITGRPDVAAVAPIAEVGGEFMSPVSEDFRFWPAGAFDETFIAGAAPELESRDPQYATDRAAYEAVLADPSLFIPTAFFLERGEGPPRSLWPGAEVVMRDPVSGRQKTLTVAAVAEAGFGNLTPLMSYAALAEVFGERVVPNKFYVEAVAGADAEAVASEINGALIAHGADAQTFAAMVADNLGQQQQFFKLMQGYLALGLLVGIAGLGVVMVRAVRERRREVGILRSLGFGSASVRRAFVTESGFVALEGIVIGVALAVITTWRLVGSANFGDRLAFDVPWPSLALLVVVTVVASLLATAAPAQQASRIRPAVALRITTD
jgi:putative ABC transport system permease protein